MTTQETLIQSLMNSLESNDLVLVNFRTKAGTIRAMGCSRNLEAIPQEKHDGRFDPKLNHESIVCVYDFQNSGWRAFRKDSVVSFVEA